MASFAKAQLLKYGWTEGKGLGKNENGIVEALKPKLKFDTAGVGHEEREYKWWESVYDEASRNVAVDTTKSSVTVKAKDEDAVEISTSRLNLGRLKKKHDLHYEKFLKACTLDNGKVVPEANFSVWSREEAAPKAPSREMTDEELFRACGGRTAHKGARHGLKLSGKLARIAAQEAELLSKLKEPSGAIADEWTEVKKVRKLKRKRRRSADETAEQWRAHEESKLDVSKCDVSKLDVSKCDISKPDVSNCDISKLHLSNRDISNSDTSNIDDNANTLPAAEDATTSLAEGEKRKKSKSARRKENRRVEALVNKLNSVVIVDDAKIEKSARRTNPTASKRKNREERAADERWKKFKKSCASSIEVIVLSDDGSINVDKERTMESSRSRKDDTTEAERLNSRIEKRKKKRQAQSEKKRFERLSDSLMAVNLCEDSVDSGRGEDLVESCENSRKLKKWKKHKKEKRDRKIEEGNRTSHEPGTSHGTIGE